MACELVRTRQAAFIDDCCLLISYLPWNVEDIVATESCDATSWSPSLVESFGNVAAFPASGSEVSRGLSVSDDRVLLAVLGAT